MKSFNKWMVVIISGLLLFGSCSEYLDKTPDSDVTDEDIFGTYKSFQGFVDPMYSYVVDYNAQQLVQSGNFGGETHSLAGANAAYVANTGQYNNWYRESGSNVQQTLFNIQGTSGIWTGSWKGIRIANLALEKLPLLMSATQEEKDLIAGQAYFFRAFFYWELTKAVGGMPYIDRVILPSEDMTFPRLTYQECAEKMVKDFDEAAKLLPVNWDNTLVGGSNPGSNTGRATKGAALAFKAKALLFAGSPLMNKYSGAADYVYNNDYMKRAADAAWEVIELANTGAYSLVPFSNYQDIFARKDGTYPYTSETMFIRMDNSAGKSGLNLLTNQHGRVYSPGRFGGNQVMECPNQKYLDKFEMADGTRYKVEYDQDNARRWDDRDPRFRQNILVDRDKAGLAAATLLKLYVGTGTDKTAANGYSSPYVIRKYWPVGVNTYDNQTAGYYYRTPHMRLADVYLIYAEAVTEAYGADGKAPTANISAVDAVNIIRNRANMPSVTSAAAGYDSFRDIVRNERAVELCFEGHYWYDIRRWYIAHLLENKEFVDLEFDQAWTPSSFIRRTTLIRVFNDPKHYWMPLPNSQTQIYKEFYQNPGW